MPLERDRMVGGGWGNTQMGKYKGPWFYPAKGRCHKTLITLTIQFIITILEAWLLNSNKQMVIENEKRLFRKQKQKSILGLFYCTTPQLNYIP